MGLSRSRLAVERSLGLKYQEAYLLQWLRDPVTQKPTAHMPKIAMTEAEARALAAYLASLQ